MRYQRGLLLVTQGQVLLHQALADRLLNFEHHKRLWCRPEKTSLRAAKSGILRDIVEIAQRVCVAPRRRSQHPKGKHRLHWRRHTIFIGNEVYNASLSLRRQA